MLGPQRNSLVARPAVSVLAVHPPDAGQPRRLREGHGGIFRSYDALVNCNAPATLHPGYEIGTCPFTPHAPLCRCAPSAPRISALASIARERGEREWERSRASGREEQARGHSLDSQRDQLSEWAEREGWSVASIFEDAGASGTAAAKRPAFMRMVEAASRHEFEAVLVKNRARYARNLADSSAYDALLAKHGVRVLSLEEPASNDDTPASYAIGTVLMCCPRRGDGIGPPSDTAQPDDAGIRGHHRAVQHCVWRPRSARSGQTQFLGPAAGNRDRLDD